MKEDLRSFIRGRVSVTSTGETISQQKFRVVKSKCTLVYSFNCSVFRRSLEHGSN